MSDTPHDPTDPSGQTPGPDGPVLPGAPGGQATPEGSQEISAAQAAERTVDGLCRCAPVTASTSPGLCARSQRRS